MFLNNTWFLLKTWSITEILISISDFNDETCATYGLKYFAEDNGTYSQYLFAIRSIDKKFIGFLSVDYTKNTTLTDQEIIGLEIDASALGGVLMNHLNRWKE